MSSIQSAFAQVGAREKFLVQVGSAVSGQAVTLKPGKSVEASMTATAFAAAVDAATPAAGGLYRDMGKTITVYNPATNLVVERYVGAQLVSGSGSEGVATSPVLVYLRVWAALATNTVGVARTG